MKHVSRPPGTYLFAHKTQTAHTQFRSLSSSSVQPGMESNLLRPTRASFLPDYRDHGLLEKKILQSKGYPAPRSCTKITRQGYVYPSHGRQLTSSSMQTVAKNIHRYLSDILPIICLLDISIKNPSYTTGAVPLSSIAFPSHCQASLYRELCLFLHKHASMFCQR